MHQIRKINETISYFFILTSFFVVFVCINI